MGAVPGRLINTLVILVTTVAIARVDGAVAAGLRGSGALHRPTGIAISGAGSSSESLVVADSGHFRIVRFTPSGRALGWWGSEGTGPGQFAMSSVMDQTAAPLGPTSVAVDRRGNVYVADSGNQRIVKFSASGAILADWPVSPADFVVQLLAIAFGPQGNIVAVMSGSADCPVQCSSHYIVQRLSPSGEVLSQWTSARPNPTSSRGTAIIHHIAVAVDATGNVYVATTGVGSCDRSCRQFAFLQKWSSTGHLLWHWSTSGDTRAWTPIGLATAPGRLYVVDQGRDIIQVWSPSGFTIGRWGGPGSSAGHFRMPSGIAVDGAGNVWVADTGNDRIQKLARTGKPLALWSGTGVSG